MTKLGQHLLILGKPWMQKHMVILDMSCDKLAFWPKHCQHLGSVPLMVNILIESHLSTSVHFSTSATISSALHVENSTTSTTAPAEPQKSKSQNQSKFHQPFQAYGQHTKALASLLTARERSTLY